MNNPQIEYLRELFHRPHIWLFHKGTTLRQIVALGADFLLVEGQEKVYFAHTSTADVMVLYRMEPIWPECAGPQYQLEKTNILLKQRVDKLESIVYSLNPNLLK